jgi:hypothetical protein
MDEELVLGVAWFTFNATVLNVFKAKRIRTFVNMERKRWTGFPLVRFDPMRELAFKLHTHSPYSKEMKKCLLKN